MFGTDVYRKCVSHSGAYSDGGISVFIPPKKSAQINFLWGKNDVRTAIQQFYTTPPPHKQTFIPPKQISGYVPVLTVAPASETERILVAYCEKDHPHNARHVC